TTPPQPTQKQRSTAPASNATVFALMVIPLRVPLLLKICFGATTAPFRRHFFAAGNIASLPARLLNYPKRLRPRPLATRTSDLDTDKALGPDRLVTTFPRVAHCQDAPVLRVDKHNLRGLRRSRPNRAIIVDAKIGDNSRRGVMAPPDE